MFSSDYPWRRAFLFSCAFIVSAMLTLLSALGQDGVEGAAPPTDGDEQGLVEGIDPAPDAQDVDAQTMPAPGSDPGSAPESKSQAPTIAGSGNAGTLAKSPPPAVLAAGDGEHFWVVTTEPDSRFKVQHRHRADPSHYMRKVDEFRGRTPRQVAAQDEALWLVLDDLSIRTLFAEATLDASSSPATWLFGDELKVSLPQGVSLYYFALGPDGPWALVRVESAPTLLELDAPAEAPATGPAATQADVQSPAPGEADTRPAIGGAAAPRPEAVHEDRLIRRVGARWLSLALPQDWPTIARGWLLFAGEGGNRPVLIVEPRDPQGDNLIVFRWSQAIARAETRPAPAGAWSRQSYAMTPGGAAQVTAVQGQPVLARHLLQAPKLSVALSVVRPEGVFELGTLTLDLPRETAWALAPSGDLATIIAADSTGTVHRATMDLMGKVVGEPAAMNSRPVTPLSRTINFAVLVAVLLLSLLIMLAFWRRDPGATRVQLPRELALGDLGARAAAGAIDLLPCVLLVVFFFNVSPRELLSDWVSNVGSVDTLTARGCLLGMFVAYCIIAELLTGKTMGKAAMGLHVTNLSGQRPRAWQVLVRNLMKSFDLIAWPLLIMPMVGPNRQRLGDLVARTVVTAPAPPEPPRREDNSEDF